jgi:anti-sigma B factor antagonist
MKIEIRDSQDSATLVLNGRLDIAGADVVALPLATLSGKKETLYVDMAGVSFIASIGLRHLVAASKAIARRGGRFTLLDPNAAVLEVITTSGLSDLLPCENGRGG